MKKLVCSLIAVSMLQSISVDAQSTDKWNGSVEFNPVFSTEKGIDPGFNINLTATRKVYDYLSVGLGIGVNESFKFNTNPTIPIFFRLHAEDYSRKMSPFVTMDIGYGINTDNVENGNLVINPTIGFKYGAFSLGVGYYGTKSFISGSKYMSSINVRLGYNFGYHRSSSPFANALRKLEFSLDFGARMLMGVNSSDYQERKSTLTTIWGEVWTNYESYISWKSKYSVTPDITMALLYPITDNFYAGIMAGFNLVLNKHEVDGYEIYYSSPGVVKYEGPSLVSNYDGTNTQSSVQIALRMKYKLKELMFAKRFYPYAQVDLGYDVNYDVEPGFFYAPSVGVSMDVAGGKHSIDLGVSYVTQKIENMNFDNSDWCSDYKNAGALRISLGYTF